MDTECEIDERSNWSLWIQGLPSFRPWLHHAKEIASSLQTFGDILLSRTDTRVLTLVRSQRKSELSSSYVDFDRLQRTCQSETRGEWECYFINKASNEDASRLRISHHGLRLLADRCHVDPTFLYVVTRYFDPLPRSFESCNDGFTVWYVIPFRARVNCTDPKDLHGNGKAGDIVPFRYLHLPQLTNCAPGEELPAMDIRGSKIAVHVAVNRARGCISVLVLNLLDGSFREYIEEPETRIQASLEQNSSQDLASQSAIVHLTILSTVARWSNIILQYVYVQLIDYEKFLQCKEDQGKHFDHLNRTLHTIAAHIHRWTSELDSILKTTLFLRKTLEDNGALSLHPLSAWEQLHSQFEASWTFSKELEKVVRNILALLFNRIQIDYDKSLVEQNRKMNELMQAQREETAYARVIALRSQALSEDMKKDSISMKTVALLTLVFLPGTSFAAILAMPFFSQNQYLSDACKFWVWIVVTIPTTLTAYLFYHVYRQREEEKMPRWEDIKDVTKASTATTLTQHLKS